MSLLISRFLSSLDDPNPVVAASKNTDFFKKKLWQLEIPPSD
jgi:hypothetical protein